MNQLPATVLESALEAALDEHLGYEQQQAARRVGRPVCQLTAADIDRVVGEPASWGLHEDQRHANQWENSGISTKPQERTCARSISLAAVAGPQSCGTSRLRRRMSRSLMIRAASAVSADSGWAECGVALARRRRAWPVPGQLSAAVRRVRFRDGRGHDPKPIAALDGSGRSARIQWFGPHECVAPTLRKQSSSALIWLLSNNF